MLVGYARTSTLDQKAGFESQIKELEAAGCERVFSEQTSALADRDQLNAAIDGFLREGDTLIVCKLDRLARSISDLWKIIGKLEKKGASLRILAMGLDTATATGRLMLNVLGSVAQFEREMMLERQREGIQRAREQGKYDRCGRTITSTRKATRARELREEGLTAPQIAERLGVTTRSIFRLLAQSQTDKQAAQ